MRGARNRVFGPYRAMIGGHKDMTIRSRIDGVRSGRSQPKSVDVGTSGVPSIETHLTQRRPRVASIGGLPHIVSSIKHAITVPRIDDKRRVEVLVIDIRYNTRRLSSPANATIIRTPKKICAEALHRNLMIGTSTISSAKLCETP